MLSRGIVTSGWGEACLQLLNWTGTSTGFVVLWRWHLDRFVQIWTPWYEKDARRFEGIPPRDPKVCKKRVRLPFMGPHKDQLYVLTLNGNRRGLEK